MHARNSFAILSLVLMLAACSGGGGGDPPPEPTTSTFTAEFDPTASVLPFPINLLFTGSLDGTLNIPVADPGNVSDPQVALNALDGFSTVAPITAGFSDTIDAGTVSPGDTVRLFEVGIDNPFLGPPGTIPFGVTRVERELMPGVDYTAVLAPADPNQTTLVILPLRPLKPKTGYMVVLTNGIHATDGSIAIPDQTYALAKAEEPLIDAAGRSTTRTLTDAEAQALEPLRQLVNSQEEAAASQGIARNRIVLSWSFLTQSIDDVLVALRATVVPQAAAVAPTGRTTEDLGLQGLAAIHTGILEVPYYLSSTDPLTEHWRGVGGSEVTRYNPMVVATETLPIPLLITVPTPISGQSEPAAGWPVAIVLHGFTRSRTDALLIANALAQAGFATVAIDLPLHGVTDPANPFFTPVERTFDLDLQDNDTGAPAPDGRIDESGVHFINFASLLTFRDNARQAVADLFYLKATLPVLDLDGDATPDLDASRVNLIGISTGSFLGTNFIALEDAVGAATLSTPSGNFGEFLFASPSFRTIFLEALANVGLIEGTPEFAAFKVAVQTVGDSTDPINYAQAAAAAHPIHTIEVVGGAGSPPDQTVNNAVPGAPLAGTEPFARVMGLTAIDATTTDPAGIRGIVRFTQGSHASIIDPGASLAVTAEMQNETARFMASDGTTLIVDNPDVVQPAP